MKQAFRLMLTTIVGLSLVLSACSKESVSSNDAVSSSTKESTNASKVNPLGKFPIVNDKITLKVAVKNKSDVQDFKTNEYTKWLEDKTNVHIEWTVLDENSFKEQVNLMLASGDLPDVIMNAEIKPEQQMVYGEQGLFVSFTDLIEKYGDNVKKIFKEIPETQGAITAPGNKIYSLPYINDCFHCSLDYKMYVFKPWLAKLGLNEPTNTEEFYQMLKAFKERDPNGNGKPDEIPMAGAISQGTPSKLQIDVFLMNSFIYDDGDKRLLLNNGKIDVAYNKPEWKEGLKYLNKLYKEGLIAPQSFTQDKNSVKKIAENPDVVIGGALPAHSPSDITIVEGPSGRWLDYQPISPLKGPNGVQLTTWLAYDKFRIGNFIMTNANKYPEATMRWADAMYDFEANLHSNFGSEGKSWDWAKQGDIGRDGQPAKYRLLVPFGRTQNESWSQQGLNYRTDKDWYAGQAVVKQPDKEKMYYDVTKKNYEPYKPNVNQVLPPLYFHPNDAQQLADIDKTINDYMRTMLARFVSGDANIDKDWDNYVKTLDGMNLKMYIELYQKAFDEQNSKKK